MSKFRLPRKLKKELKTMFPVYNDFYYSVIRKKSYLKYSDTRKPIYFTASAHLKECQKYANRYCIQWDNITMIDIDVINYNIFNTIFNLKIK